MAEAPPGPQRLGPQRLTPNLLGRVLDLLAPADLRAARLAGRIFVEASRKHTGRAATVTLTFKAAFPEAAATAANAGPRPKWEHFPQLRRLVLRHWPPRQLPCLRRILAGGGAGPIPGGVEEVEYSHSGSAAADAPMLAAVLRRTPRVAALRLESCLGSDGDENLAVLATAAALARHVTRLSITGRGQLDAAAAALIADSMPGLAALAVPSAYNREADAEALQAGLWAALPCARLAELRVKGEPTLLRPPPEGLHWPRMRALGGIRLLAEDAAALALGLPALEELHAWFDGEWAGLELLAGASFGCLTRLDLGEPCGSFCRAAPLPRLFPALERLEWRCSGDAPIECDISGLTRLTHLELRGEEECITIGRAVLQGMGLLRGLQELAVGVTVDEVPLLALPPSITSLTVSVALRRDGDGVFVWGYDSGAASIGACELLGTVSRGLRLRKLRFHAPACPGYSQEGLAQLVGAGLSSLEDLELTEPLVTLHDISVLAKLPRLRRLVVTPGDIPEDDEVVLAEVVARQAARGLEIEQFR